jgi:hypothetical protein
MDYHDPSTDPIKDSRADRRPTSGQFQIRVWMPEVDPAKDPHTLLHTFQWYGHSAPHTAWGRLG